ncbi:MAG: GDSL-type esterase/lipase family protein [Tannerella sp.]|jgi:lysophospholipase L1-like esterase|nr:GDSL-type esterase/lipase family protein [Tannerella sp.]
MNHILKKIEKYRIVFIVSVFVSAATASFPQSLKGDGIHDDAEAIQAMLDSRDATVYLPAPQVCYKIGKTLKIHSGQTLMVDRNAVIRLADHAGAHLLTNDDHAGGNERIAVIGGIWDGNNRTQTMVYHEDRNAKDLPYDPERYLGILMVFNNVKDLHVSGVTFRDPETYAFLGGNLLRFTIENITFDFNLLRGNMDGIHIEGNSHQGRITNLKGTTNDDLVALNADDVPLFEMSRGPITDIQVDGVWAEDAHRAVRILSCGSPVKRVKISNVFGTYVREAVILSNHGVHPGCSSIFEDISITGLFCSNSRKGSKDPHIRIHAPAQVSSFTVSDCHRTEEASASDHILIEKGACIEFLSVENASLQNRTNGTIHFIRNLGNIDRLCLSNIFTGNNVTLMKNEGVIKNLQKTNIPDTALTILGLGDSITEGGSGFCSYLFPLWKQLTDAGYRIRFVGPRRTAYDGQTLEHAGFGGKTAEYLNSVIDTLYKNYPADVVLLHAGHNHFDDEQPVQGIVSACESIIEKIKSINPDAKIFIAQVIPSGKLPKYAYIAELNKQIVIMAERMHVTPVNLAEGFVWQQHTVSDKVHPNPSGAEKMAAVWFEALKKNVF